MIRLAIAAGAEFPDLGGELPPIADALAAVGILAEVAVWDDPATDWAAFDAVIVRSTWDYIERADQFRAWIDRVAAAVPLANPAPLLQWNIDKSYLADLAAAGVPIVDTVLVAPGEPVAATDWDEVVVKPAISAGGRLSGRFAAGDAAIARTVSRIHAEGTTAILQPYVPAIDVDGEANVLAFGGVASHALSKGGVLPVGLEPDLDMHPHVGQLIQPLALTDDLVAFADVVLDAITGLELTQGPPVYARIDSVIATDGTRRLMEAELIEPYLYLAEAPDPAAAAARYAQAIRAWLDTASRPPG